MRLLGKSQSLIHVAGELLLVAAGGWGLYLRYGQGSSPLSTTHWFGPLALLAIGLCVTVLPLAPARDAAWVHDWFRGQPGLSSLLWSFGVCGCLYSLWLQYDLQFSIRPVLMLLPGFVYWFAVSCPGHNIQQRNIERARERAAGETAQTVEEVQGA